MLSDQQIIALVIKGKIDSFGELVARYQLPDGERKCSFTPEIPKGSSEFSQ